MNRIKKHLGPKRRIADRLRRAGFRVVSVTPAEGYDLLVNERVRVVLRVAYPRLRRHYVAVGDRRYTYRYRSWHFNFHRHGRIDRHYTDVFICVAMEPRHQSREAIFVIPWAAVSGKTFSLHAGRKPYKGQYRQYVDRWRVVTDAVAETPVRLQHVA